MGLTTLLRRTITAASILAAAAATALSIFGYNNAEVLIAILLGLFLLFFSNQAWFQERTAFEMSRLNERVQSSDTLIVTQDVFYQNFRKALINARKSVDITSHEPRLPGHSGIKEKSDSWELIFKRARTQKNVIFRLLLAANTPERRKWIAEKVETLRECANVSVRLVEFEPEKHPGRLSVQIIDRTEAFVIESHHSLNEDDADMISTDLQTVEFFRSYFDNYWSRAKYQILKDGLTTDEEMLESLRSNVN